VVYTQNVDLICWYLMLVLFACFSVVETCTTDNDGGIDIETCLFQGINNNYDTTQLVHCNIKVTVLQYQGVVKKQDVIHKDVTCACLPREVADVLRAVGVKKRSVACASAAARSVSLLKV
jgi:hypothetical protein